MAGIDWRIPAGVQGAETDSLFGTLGKLYTIREMQAREEDRRMQSEMRRRALEDQDAMGQAFAGDQSEEAVISALQRTKPHLVPIARERFGKWKTEQAETEKKLTEAEASKSLFLSNRIREIEEDGYDAGEFLLALDRSKRIIGPEAYSYYRQQVEAANDDPAKIRAIVEGIKQGSSDYTTRQTAAASATRAETAAKDADATRPGKIAEGAQKGLQVTAQRLAAIDNPFEYERQRAALPPAEQILFPTTYDRDRILAAGMTPQERSTDADRDASRGVTMAGQAETKRHNFATEAQARRSLQETIDEHKRVAARSGPNGEALTPNTISVTERWYAENMNAIDKDEDLDDGQKATQRKRVEDAYTRAMGEQRRLEAPTATGGRLGDLFFPGPTGGPKLGGVASTKPAPAGSQPAANATPSWVSETLSGQKPGTYALDDGSGNVSTWELRPDGTLVKVTPRGAKAKNR
jgi:hypothetical protein